MHDMIKYLYDVIGDVINQVCHSLFSYIIINNYTCSYYNIIIAKLIMLHENV